MRRLRILSLALPLLAVTSGAFALSDCGGKVPPIQPLPAAVEVVDQDINAYGNHALDIVKAANAIAVDAAALYVKEFRDRNLVPPALARAIDDGFRGYTAKMRVVIDEIESGVIKTWAALKAKLDPITTDLQKVVDAIKGSDGESLKVRIGRGFQIALGILLSLSGPGFMQ